MPKPKIAQRLRSTPAQLYDLKLEYYNASGLARIQLGWTAPGLQRAAVPRAQLYPPVNAFNQRPTITFTNPADNSGLPSGNVLFTVKALDADSAIQKVRYFADGELGGGKHVSAIPIHVAESGPRLSRDCSNSGG
jgi:hypothetical protein